MWLVDVHLDGSEEAVPAIVDLGCQSSILNWRAANALGYRLNDKRDDVASDSEGDQRIAVVRGALLDRPLQPVSPPLIGY